VAGRHRDRRRAPKLAVDAHGIVHLAYHEGQRWELFGGRRPRGLGYAVSRDGGASFSAPGVVPHSMDAGWNGSSQGLLMQKLAVSRDGALAVVNSSLQPGKRSRVWLMRGRLSAR
jgi:hypothetical protein